MRQQNRISIMEAWPATLFICDWAEHGQRAPRIVEHIRAQSEGSSKPIESGVAASSKSRDGLIESPLDVFATTTSEDIKALAGWIAQCVKAAVNKVNGGELAMERLQVRFTESWFHITNHGGFHDAHVHGNCSWCGIYYLKAGDPDVVPADGTDSAGNGINRFYSHIPTGGYCADYGSKYLRRSNIDVQPIDGRMVLFPSFLLHSALPYRGAEDRMVFAFNTQTHVLNV